MKWIYSAICTSVFTVNISHCPRQPGALNDCLTSWHWVSLHCTALYCYTALHCTEQRYTAQHWFFVLFSAHQWRACCGCETFNLDLLMVGNGAGNTRGDFLMQDAEHCRLQECIVLFCTLMYCTVFYFIVMYCRGKFGGDHISLIISKTINCKRSNFFPYRHEVHVQVIHIKKKSNWFYKNLENELFLGSYFDKSY